MTLDIFNPVSAVLFVCTVAGGIIAAGVGFVLVAAWLEKKL